MSKRLILGLLTLSAITFLGVEAHAGCIFNPPFCASYITGSGMPTALVTAETRNTPVEIGPACPAVRTEQIQPCDPEEECCFVCEGFPTIAQLDPLPPPITPASPLSMRLLGTVGTNCGFAPRNETCEIAGVGVCGTGKELVVARKQLTPGPLTINSPDGFGQSDGATSAANFRFELDQNEQTQVCLETNQPFVSFIAREGFFETCVAAPTPTDPFHVSCIKEFCKVDLGGISLDVPRTYNCTPVSS